MASDDKSPPRFQYQPLHDPERQIRLVKLSPESKNGVIQCSLRHAELNSKHVALSYVWGPPEPTRDILIDGKTFNIRDNLWQFLSHECQKRRSRKCSYWIDQISINQEDTIEKNHQVYIMGTIYKSAIQVFVWLGDWDEEILRAMTGAAMHPVNAVFWWWLKLRSALHRMISSYEDTRQVYMARVNHYLDHYFEHWTSGLPIHLGCLLELNPYWRRAWTTPEFLLARDLKIISGKCEMGLELFDRVYHYAPSYLAIDEDSLAVSAYIQSAQQQRRKNRRRAKKLVSPLTLSDLLRLFQGAPRKCEKQTDTIYSLLCLVEGESLVKPDYSKDPNTLHLEVFIYEWDPTCGWDRDWGPRVFSDLLACSLNLDAHRAWHKLLKYLGIGRFSRYPNLGPYYVGVEAIHEEDRLFRESINQAVIKAKALLVREHGITASRDSR
ncbi:hypothetical protein H2200_004499 [Cladophialophora chaetospira]|uniref:Heterokaryon incompatibility domain-containing protein n=1 Tax=Cladophialophora chaetospira TaxID=386627 RepID=A0AA39CK85_9EURO|nr:hypothetical protein H2200_004499 [Cladophialophora chaetospira]